MPAQSLVVFYRFSLYFLSVYRLSLWAGVFNLYGVHHSRPALHCRPHVIIIIGTIKAHLIPVIKWVSFVHQKWTHLIPPRIRVLLVHQRITHLIPASIRVILVHQEITQMIPASIRVLLVHQEIIHPIPASIRVILVHQEITHLIPASIRVLLVQGEEVVCPDVLAIRHLRVLNCERWQHNHEIYIRGLALSFSNVPKQKIIVY